MVPDRRPRLSRHGPGPAPALSKVLAGYSQAAPDHPRLSLSKGCASTPTCLLWPHPNAAGADDRRSREGNCPSSPNACTILPPSGTGTPSPCGMAEPIAWSKSPAPLPCGTTAASPRCRSAGCLYAIPPANSNPRLFSPPISPPRRARCCSGSSHAGSSKSPLSLSKGQETQRQWSDRAVLRITPALLGLFSLVTLWADDLDTAALFQPRTAVGYAKPHPTPELAEGQQCHRRRTPRNLDASHFLHVPEWRRNHRNTSRHLEPYGGHSRLCRVIR